MIVNAFITHKKAERFSDCQDRFGVNYDTKSIALSDGMGSTWQQKIWAHILVSSFTESNSLLYDQDNVKDLSNIWRKSVSNFIDKLKSENAPQNIIYRNERNLASGRSAGATFVGVRLVDNKWKGNVLGDSCLIVWNGEYAEFHTSQDTDEFDSFPDYFDSNDNNQGKGVPKEIDIDVKENEIVILVSDPFSDFLLERKKDGSVKEYISKLISLNSHDEFENLVEEWRNSGMHNDDTTLIVVKQEANFSVLEEGFVDDIEDKINKEEAELRAKEEAELKAKEEAELRTKEEAELRTKEEAELRTKEEAELKAKEETELKDSEEVNIQELVLTKPNENACVTGNLKLKSERKCLDDRNKKIQVNFQSASQINQSSQVTGDTFEVVVSEIKKQLHEQIKRVFSCYKYKKLSANGRVCLMEESICECIMNVLEKYIKK